jgi:hypothetical protein
VVRLFLGEARRYLDTDSLKAKVLSAGPPSDSDQRHIACNLLLSSAGSRLNRQGAVVVCDLGTNDLGRKLEAELEVPATGIVAVSRAVPFPKLPKQVTRRVHLYCGTMRLSLFPAALAPRHDHPQPDTLD